MSASLHKLISEYGDVRITSIQLNRTPINGFLQKIINILSLGALQRAKKKLNYDDIFHLFMHIHLENQMCVLIEKDEVIKVYYSCLPRDKAEVFFVGNYIPNSLTVNEFIQNGAKLDGIYNFVHYTASTYNCQRS